MAADALVHQLFEALSPILPPAIALGVGKDMLRAFIDSSVPGAFPPMDAIGRTLQCLLLKNKFSMNISRPLVVMDNELIILLVRALLQHGSCHHLEKLVHQLLISSGEGHNSSLDSLQDPGTLPSCLQDLRDIADSLLAKSLDNPSLQYSKPLFKNVGRFFPLPLQQEELVLRQVPLALLRELLLHCLTSLTSTRCLLASLLLSQLANEESILDAAIVSLPKICDQLQAVGEKEEEEEGVVRMENVMATVVAILSAFQKNRAVGQCLIFF